MVRKTESAEFALKKKRRFVAFNPEAAASTIVRLKDDATVLWDQIILIEKLQDEFGFTHEAIAAAIGVSSTWVWYRDLREHLHPDVFHMLHKSFPPGKRLPLMYINEIARLPKTAQPSLAQKAVKTGMSLAVLKANVSALKAKK